MSNIKILPINPIIQQGHRLCWAACMEMIAEFLPPASDMQQKVLLDNYLHLLYRSATTPAQNQALTDMLNTPLICNERYQTIASDKDDYSQVLASVGIQCVHYKSINFPKWSFIQSKIVSGTPILLGSDYPFDGGHAVVIIGYFIDENSASKPPWVLVNDPLSNKDPCNGHAQRAAWVYQSLREYCMSQHSKNVFITDFKKAANPIINFHTLTWPNTSEPNYPRLPSVSSIDDFKENIYKIIAVIVSNLRGFFNLNSSNLHLKSTKLLRKYFIDSSTLTKLITSLADLGNNNNGSPHTLTVYESDSPKLDLVLFNSPHDDGFLFLGAQEYLNVTVVKDINALVELDGTILNFTFNFDHEHPNYSLAVITPDHFYFLHFQSNEQDYFTPFYDYELLGVKPGYAYERATLAAILINNLSL
ncbi:hypothetical protein FHS57_000298 [Runella defluvii]|uniref:Peptidase C39-like domain-containing protein n=1 Tax=Runella defluvii TaxID=370973 RepID=A0A7W5ZFK2_9BACT|nr:papain-like cysteine protease family protein [Runella defluvii]MBB3836316.1 hypothetical protein [Runella defluvii]